MYEIQFTAEARDDLKALRKTDQKLVVDAIELHLQHDPGRQTRNRKKLRPNKVAGWELRVREFRVLYNLDETAGIVSIEAVGFKIGNVLFVRGLPRQL
jgi:mRNA-degrading endonuclease RelE of RelBE toxin-antitoxin system